MCESGRSESTRSDHEDWSSTAAEPRSPCSEKVHTQLQQRQPRTSHQPAARLGGLRQEEEEAASRARYSRSSTESSDMYLPDLSLPPEYDPSVSRHGRRRTFSQLMAEDAPSAPRSEDKMGQRLSEMLAREQQHNSKRQRLEALESRGPPRAAPGASGKPSANRHGAVSSFATADNSHLIHVARQVSTFQIESPRSGPTSCPPSSGRQSPFSSSSEV